MQRVIINKYLFFCCCCCLGGKKNEVELSEKTIQVKISKHCFIQNKRNKSFKRTIAFLFFFCVLFLKKIIFIYFIFL